MRFDIVRFLFNLTPTERDAASGTLGELTQVNGKLQFKPTGGTFKDVLLDGDVVGTNPATESALGTVELATNVQFQNGDDLDDSKPLVPKPSQIQSALSAKVQIGGDIGGTIAAPRVLAATSDAGLHIKNVAATQQARLKATGSSEISFRNAADDGYADLKVGTTQVNGDLSITGKLSFQGSVTEVDADNLSVKDNVIELNKGEAGAGVTLGTAGLQVDRGTLDNARLVFDESDDSWKAGIGSTLFTFVRKYTETLSATPATTHTVTHNLGTKNVSVAVYNGDVQEYYDIQTATNNTITITSASEIANRRVVVIG